MKNLFQIQTLPSLFDKKIAGLGNTGKSNGGLFNSILSRIKEAAGEGESKLSLYAAKLNVPFGQRLLSKGIALYSGDGENSLKQRSLFAGASFSPEKGALNKMLNMGRTSETIDIQGLKKKIQDLCISSTELIIPESALLQLTNLLKANGYSQDKIDNIISLSRGAEGLIQSDRLLALISCNVNTSGPGDASALIAGIVNTPAVGKTSALIAGNMNISGAGNAAVIEQSFVPGVQEVLFRMGLGAGEVKSVIEQSVNTRGEIELPVLTAALKKILPETGSEFLNSLAANNIKVKPQFDQEGLLNSGLEKKIADLPVASSQDMLKHVKQNIASILREKGVPAQEVKSFLEGFNLEHKNAAKKEGSEALSQMPVNRAAVKNLMSSGENPWNERILGILKNEKILISEQFNKDASPEKAALRLNMDELIKHGNQKTGVDQMIQVAGRANGDIITGSDIKKAFQNKNERFVVNTKESLSADSMIIKAEKGITATGTVARSNEALNLPQPLPKILDKMFFMIHSGEQKGRIFINPPELGRLDLNLTIKDGHLQANLNAESVMVKEIIEANLNQLKQQLNSQGITVDRFDVMVGLGEERLREDNSWAGRDRKKAGSDRNNAGIPAEIAEKAPVRNYIINDSQVDVHV